MIAGVAASFVSGITEPMEFSFMFIAPMLFLFHSIMGGISFMLMSVLGVIVGNTGEELLTSLSGVYSNQVHIGIGFQSLEFLRSNLLCGI